MTHAQALLVHAPIVLTDTHYRDVVERVDAQMQDWRRHGYDAVHVEKLDIVPSRLEDVIGHDRYFLDSPDTRMRLIDLEMRRSTLWGA